MVVAFGVAELVHGLYPAVPSVLVAVAQRIIEFTPGDFATRAVEILGKADIPVLVTVTVFSTLALAGVLAYLSLRSRFVALLGVGVLAAVALAASFSEPAVSPLATVLTDLGALGVGSAVAVFLLHTSSELRPSESGPKPESPGTEDEPGFQGVRSREAGSSRGVVVGRRNFLILSGSAALAGLAATGVGRTLAGGGELGGSNPVTLSSGSVTLPGPLPEASLDVPGIPPLITPAEDSYLIDTALISPRINIDSWTLNVTGAVDNPIELTYSDLTSLPTREADITLSCVSNEVGGGLISNGRWTGVLLSDVLAEAGFGRDKIGSASEQLVGRSVDGWTAGFKQTSPSTAARRWSPSA